MNQKYTLKCIHCENEISLGAGLAPGINYESIRLQAKEIGVEIYCDQCKKIFLFHEPVNEIAAPVSSRIMVDPKKPNRDYLLP